jgi:Uma2 family endonuclease
MKFMASTSHRTPADLLTYEEWLRLPPVEDGTDEVVNGVLRFMPPTHYPHAWIVQRLVEAFIGMVDRDKVQILGSNFGLMISREPLTCRSPDLALYWRDQMVIQDGLCWSPPDLIVEVISPSETKRRKEEKLADYASIGVPEAWLVSPEARSVEIRLLAEGRLAVSEVLVSGDLHPVRFPQVAVGVPAIYPD